MSTTIPTFLIRLHPIDQSLSHRRKQNKRSKLIEALRTVTSAPEDEDCPICLMEYGGSEVKEMPCKHMYHKDCIHKWLGVNAKCPVCRYQMPVGDDDDYSIFQMLFSTGTFFRWE